MAKVVIITTTGAAKKNFINKLQRQTGGAIKLVIIQNKKSFNLIQKVKNFYKKTGWRNLLNEIYHFMAVRLSKKKLYHLSVPFLSSNMHEREREYHALTIETDDVNSDHIYELVYQKKPDLIIIWGGNVLKPRILSAAPYAVNMHFGYVPYYRGVNGIQEALINDDLEHIGISIHYAVPEVDAGEIIKIVTIPQRKSVEDFFRTLNDAGTREYLKIVKKIIKGERIPSVTQDLTQGKKYLMRNWTYRKQHMLAKKIANW